MFTFLYDLGGEVRIGDAARLLANVPTAERVEITKGAPTYVELVQPFNLRYPEREVETTRGTLRVTATARVHPIGAIAVNLRVPFELPSLDDVNALTHASPSGGGTMESLARGYVTQLESLVKPALIETYDATVDPEAYLVIVLTRSSRSAVELFEKERQLLAGLLAGERRPERLSQEEVRDNLRTWFKYYEDDLVVVDWERALVVEPSGKYDDVLAVIESANLQLLELRAYDRYLDQVLEEAYEDITRFYGRGGLFRSARNVQEDLSNARIDLVRVTDAINNIGKIFGDYYLAKLHLGMTERFHLHEWEQIVREKMATLNELYTLASHEVEHRRGIALETMIVLLFIIDLVLIFLVSV